ncbi:hypothetical protein B0187_03335 [Haemophilus paracuniculus]|uniref:O-antigen ligase-related domain-containing protein n=1 Tax=Haemophilus paracuniculus TaxID=734 RepID=A0A1T0AU17_9PAST|nr:hypothetical protein B0187_03335 [Haemophilus paracuniculus]
MLLVVSVLYGIYYLIQNKKINIQHKWLFYTVLFYFVGFFISWIFNKGAFKQLDNPLRVLLLFTIVIFLCHHKFNYKFLVWSIPIGSVVAGIVALYHRFILNLPSAFRLQMKIQLGDISMSLGMLSLVIALYFGHKKQNKYALITLLASFGGILASVLSQARGGWIGVPLLLAVILFIYRKELNKKLLSKMIIIVSLLIGSLFLFNSQTKIMDRIIISTNEVIRFSTQNKINSSAGERFEMWKGAYFSFQEKPLFGWGEEGFLENQKKLVSEKKLAKRVENYTHAHNQYIDALAKRGINGLIGLLAIFIIPLVFFIHTLRKYHNTVELKLLSTLGIVHIISVMSYSLTQSFLAHNSGNIFYFFVLFVLYSAIYIQKQNYVNQIVK